MLLLFYYIYIVIEFISQLRKIERKKEARQFLEITVEPRRTPPPLEPSDPASSSAPPRPEARSSSRQQFQAPEDVAQHHQQQRRPSREKPHGPKDSDHRPPRGPPEVKPRTMRDLRVVSLPKTGDEEKATTPKKKVRIQEPMEEEQEGEKEEDSSVQTERAREKKERAN